MDQNIAALVGVHGNDLRAIEKNMQLYETVRLNGFTIIPDGADLGVKPPDTIDPGQLDIIMQMLKNNKQDLVVLTGDLGQTRNVLAEQQTRMAVTYDWLMAQLDLWDRLEKLYREIAPQDTECIHGPEKFCSEAAIVNCKACEGRHDGQQLT